MSHVLVTGASGFIGGHLAESLAERGHRVRCLVRRSSNVAHLPSADVELVYGDLADAIRWDCLLADIDVVYHVAGKTCALSARQLMQVNRDGTAELARACARLSHPPALLLISSLAAAGPSPDGRPRRESDPSCPISHYGRSKRAGELAAAQWAGTLPLTILRPGIVLGPRNRDMLPVFRSIYRLGVHAVPGLRPLRVSLIHVDDLTEIALRAVQRGKRVAGLDCRDAPAGQGYYFACDPDPPTYARLGQLIGQALGRKRVLMLRLPAPIPWLAAAGAECVQRCRGKPGPFNLDKVRETRAGSWIGSGDAVRDQLGFQPPLDLAARIAQTARWYLESGWL